MNEKIYSKIYVLLTVVVTFLTIMFYFKLFVDPFMFDNILFVIMTMVLTVLSSILLISLAHSQKREMGFVSVIKEVEKDDCAQDNCSEHMFNELQKELKNIKSNLTNLNSDDLKRIQFENCKRDAFSRIKLDERNLRRRINAVCENFEGPMRLSLFFAIGFAIAGLLPLLVLAFKGDCDNSPINSVSSAIVSRWPYFGLTLVVEFVSGVFFKIYYKLVEEIKYYADEISRITRNAVSLETLVLLDRFECIDKFVMKLVETQKNRVLKKNESTEFIEKQKLENMNNDKLLDLLEGFVKKEANV